MEFAIPIILIFFVLLAYAACKTVSDDRKPNGTPTKGDLTCPFCQSFLARNVFFVGQDCQCPKCSARFSAPNYRGSLNKTADLVGAAMFQVFLVFCFGALLIFFLTR